MRLPGYVIGVEAVFGAAGQRLHLTHQAGSSAEPYVDGALACDTQGRHSAPVCTADWTP